MSLASQSAGQICGVSCLSVLTAPTGSAKIFEFCVDTVLLNGLIQEDSGTNARRQPWNKD